VGKRGLRLNNKYTPERHFGCYHSLHRSGINNIDQGEGISLIVIVID
jgi:hypothetical protein